MNINGTVESKRRDGKGIKIGEYWYSVMFSSELDDINKGDTVEVEFTTKPSPSGVDYRNIKKVKKVAGPAARPVGMPAIPTGRVFPIPGLSPERAIIRQNAIGHAVKVVTVNLIDDAGELIYGTPEELATKVIEIARMFEAYSSGDLDRDIVNAEVSRMLAKETN